MTERWVCIQLGAREHYAIPLVLARRGQLERLLTDAWAPPGSALGFLHRKLHERFHPGLDGARVRAWTAGATVFELLARARRLTGWRLLLARNGWFQSRVARYLAAVPTEMGTGTEQDLVSSVPLREHSEPVPSSSSGWNHRPILFSYSYTALAPFRIAKERGWRTVLGQIDPGPPEERIVAELRRRYPQYAGMWQPAPAEYWATWREECDLADVIMVNSEWSRQAMLTEGIPDDKIAVVPLAYEPPPDASAAPRGYPDSFTVQRPLRVLFLGSAIIRKGIHDLVDAAERLAGEPVVFDVAGGHGPLPKSLPRNITFHGAVTRSEASRWYQQADVFVLPTHSDGFALTQLEAMAHGLPVIATPNCGDVVEHEQSGLLVHAGDTIALADSIRRFLRSPGDLSRMGAAARARATCFSLDRLSQNLRDLERRLLGPGG